MESITKFRQPDAVLRAIIERAYGPDAVPDADGFATEMSHGWFNVAYRLDLADDRSVVLKIAPPPGVQVMTYERDMMAGEVAALRLIRERTGVPVPEVHHYDATHELVDADWFAMGFVEGDNLGMVKDSLAPDDYRDYLRLMGRANRELNAIPGVGFGRFHAELFPTWREAFGKILADVVADGERRGVDLGWDYAEVRRVIREHEHHLDGVERPVFCEWDLWESNMIVRDGRLSGIIDHERAFWGDPIMEAGVLAGGAAPDSATTPYLEGYGRGPLTDDEFARRRLYDLHLFLIMVIETVYRGHTTTDQLDMARPLLDAAMEALGGRRS
ncbi:MAG TPA: aminoglycoside phosphotransferase family protein [Propionibacteriaceae bacterium]|nr:aminoglycoside phosphotransferase family protein [Propionibacteriaceae bacterium]